MKAEELRIGNYVALPNNIVVKISRKDFAIYKGLANIEDYNPIPLTEEWLLKFGFEKKSWIPTNNRKDKLFENCLIKNEIVINTNINGSFYLCGCTVFTYIFHIHQLQNLYFALTNEELCLQSEQK
jgi:hypothetical protein